MTDVDLIEKRLAFIGTCVVELRTLARPDAIATDVREERFVEHTLQRAIQAVVDVASHIVSDDQLGEPATNQALFDLLRGAGWVDDRQRAVLRSMVGFRNVLVHEYVKVDLAIVRDIIDNHLGELEEFVRAVRARLT